MEKLSHATESILDENVGRLAALFPEVVTEVREPDGTLRHAIDVDALKERVGDVAEGHRERYQFTWPGKGEARQEAYRRIDKCLRPCPEESVDWDTTGNLYIEGDNLDALKLLRNTYAGRVKMIYIDPPYNTGHDFIYDDDFSRAKADYDAESGDYDEEGGRLVANPESNGRFHSDWCSMMYPRLLLARDLLSEDGVIFVSIDDSEVHNLDKLLCEVFGASNDAQTFIWKKGGTGKNDSQFAVCEHEYVTCFVKNIGLSSFALDREATVTTSYSFHDEKGNYSLVRLDQQNLQYSPSLDYDLVGPDGTVYKLQHKNPRSPNAIWRWSKDKVAQNMDQLVFRNGHVYTKNYAKEGGKARTILADKRFGVTRTGKANIEEVMGEAGIFDFPKPVGLIRHFLMLLGDSSALVLDFFSGSATTAHAVMKLNAEDGGSRRFIMVQLPEVCDEKSEAAKAGYKNICEIGKERIRRAGKKIAAEVEESNRQLKLGEEPKKVPDIGFRVFTIDSSNFEDVSVEPGEFSQDAMLRFADNLKLDRTPDDLIIQVMLKKQIELSAPIEKLDIDGCTVFSVDGGRLVACFDRDVPVEAMTAMAKMEPDYAVMRDASFAGDDAVSNFAEIFKNYSSITEVEVI